MSISSCFFHQIVDFTTKSSLVVAFISKIVFRENFNDPILVTERHFHFKKVTHMVLYNIRHSIVIAVEKKMVWSSKIVQNLFTIGRKDSRVTITLNRETTFLTLQNIFRHSHAIFSCKWAFNGCTFEFYIKVRYKITRPN